MALGPMDFKDTSIKTGTITKASDVTGDLANTTCYKKNGMVCVAGRLLNTSASADHAIFKVPSGFRPATQTYCAGGARTTGWQLGSICVTAAGDVEFKISTSTADAFVFSACYPAAD